MKFSCTQKTTTYDDFLFLETDILCQHVPLSILGSLARLIFSLREHCPFHRRYRFQQTSTVINYSLCRKASSIQYGEQNVVSFVAIDHKVSLELYNEYGDPRAHESYVLSTRTVTNVPDKDASWCQRVSRTTKKRDVEGIRWRMRFAKIKCMSYLRGGRFPPSSSALRFRDGVKSSRSKTRDSPSNSTPWSSSSSSS